jgi:hypothetical protein
LTKTTHRKRAYFFNLQRKTKYKKLKSLSLHQFYLNFLLPLLNKFKLKKLRKYNKYRLLRRVQLSSR